MSSRGSHFHSEYVPRLNYVTFYDSCQLYMSSNGGPSVGVRGGATVRNWYSASFASLNHKTTAILAHYLRSVCMYCMCWSAQYTVQVCVGLRNELQRKDRGQNVRNSHHATFWTECSFLLPTHIIEPVDMNMNLMVVLEEKSGESPMSVGLILWGPQMFVQNFIAIHGISSLVTRKKMAINIFRKQQNVASQQFSAWKI